MEDLILDATDTNGRENGEGMTLHSWNQQVIRKAENKNEW
jgi:hypothetical protein